LAIAFIVLRRLDMTGRSRSLSKEELNLVEFLYAQVASLSSSLAYEASIAELPLPTSVACQIIDLQSDARGRGHSRQSHVIALLWRGVWREPLLCVAVDVLS
jgi:hypothetical protein